MPLSSDNMLTCRLCGQDHQAVPLSAGETARCVRCGARLETEPRGHRCTAVAFALAGLAFAAPAAWVPFITVEKLGNVRTGNFIDGVIQLNAHDMPFLAAWVLICGGIAPLLLLGSLLISRRHPLPAKRLGDALVHWSMPEVYVLAVFVALTRLGSIVEVETNAGFWSYCAMSVALLLAWRAFRLQPPPEPSA